MNRPEGCYPCSWPECGCQYSPTPAAAESDKVASLKAEMERLHDAKGRFLGFADEYAKELAALSHVKAAAASKSVKLCYVKRWRTLVELPEKYADEIVQALRNELQAAPVIVGYQRRSIGPDGTPWSNWYPADDEPTPENMKFDGHMSYEYRPVHAGSPLPRPQSRSGE